VVAQYHILGKLRKEGGKFEAGLGYKVQPCLKKKKNTQKKPVSSMRVGPVSLPFTAGFPAIKQCYCRGGTKSLFTSGCLNEEQRSCGLELCAVSGLVSCSCGEITPGTLERNLSGGAEMREEKKPWQPLNHQVLMTSSLVAILQYQGYVLGLSQGLLGFFDFC
jgi:hypothetical protein